MAKLSPAEILQNELAQIQKKVIAEIEDLISHYASNEALTKDQLMALVNEFDFSAYLSDNGMDEVVQKYLNSFDNLVTVQGKAIVGSVRLDDIINQTEIIKDSVGKYILGKADSYTELLRVNILQGLMGEISDSAIIDNLKTTNLTDAQMNTVIDTSYANQERSITSEIFADKPEQRFRYAGNLINTSSDICTWLIQNQRAEGYTREEINAGIETPYGMVDWFGRVPNFNCGHQWLPI